MMLTKNQQEELDDFEKAGELQKVYDGLGNFNGWEDENGKLYPTFQDLIDEGWLSKGIKKVKKVT